MTFMAACSLLNCCAAFCFSSGCREGQARSPGVCSCPSPDLGTRGEPALCAPRTSCSKRVGCGPSRRGQALRLSYEAHLVQRRDPEHVVLGQVAEVQLGPAGARQGLSTSAWGASPRAGHADGPQQPALVPGCRMEVPGFGALQTLHCIPAGPARPGPQGIRHPQGAAHGSWKPIGLQAEAAGHCPGVGAGSTRPALPEGAVSAGQQVVEDVEGGLVSRPPGHPQLLQQHCLGAERSRGTWSRWTLPAPHPAAGTKPPALPPCPRAVRPAGDHAAPAYPAVPGGAKERDTSLSQANSARKGNQYPPAPPLCRCKHRGARHSSAERSQTSSASRRASAGGHAAPCRETRSAAGWSWSPPHMA